MTIRVGTRGSALALAQAGHIADRLAEAADEEVVLVPISSEGDIDSSSLSVIGGRGVFAGALREALLAGRCDVLVHSLKDLPTVPAEGLVVAAVPERADARDVLCARDGATLDTLPAGARVGTGSPRRIAQLRRRRPDLEIVDLRGNVDTRLLRAKTGDLDAVVLSLAGLERLGRADEVTEYLDLDAWPTAAGQGALAIEVREADAAHLRPPFPEPGPVGRALRGLSDATSEHCIAAERDVLRGLDAGCTAPIGVSARIIDGELALHAVVYAPSGEANVEHRATAPFDSDDLSTLQDAAAALARETVTALLDDGAADLAPVGAA
ncbi:hydroxymethylbilane synthase [Herbiconiux sp. L3-i23]|uniref:hydroxymethylbilane synthase n=1 Tax=Herbiconiux sp. L3-i23 TaxID=2905871 RepID=UPI0020701892|nr:hydroxymethylbilane synthase [Herbiconiux sp. L3-i23]BDI21292.1 porphobilinogen deaminase 1 [Herbiconiux sp. L3-i23]